MFASSLFGQIFNCWVWQFTLFQEFEVNEKRSKHADPGNAFNEDPGGLKKYFSCELLLSGRCLWI